MASNKFVYQQVTNVSINRDKLIDIASNSILSKKDYKVLIMLLTQLNGYHSPEDRTNYKDPLNYKKIDIGTMSKTLDISKKDLKKSLDNLLMEDYIEMGTNDTIKDGWRFTF